jgi:hypothetical protein
MPVIYGKLIKIRCVCGRVAAKKINIGHEIKLDAANNKC